MNEQYPRSDFSAYEEELRGQQDALVECDDIQQLAAYEANFTHGASYKQAEVLGMIGYIQHSMLSGEKIHGDVFDRVRRKAEDIGLFGSPVRVSGNIRPLDVGVFRETRWGVISKESIVERQDGREYQPVKQKEVIFTRLIEMADGSIALAIKNEHGSEELGICIDELSAYEQEMCVENTTVSLEDLEDDIARLRNAAAGYTELLLTDTTELPNDKGAEVARSIMEREMKRLPCLEINDRVQLDIKGSLKRNGEGAMGIDYSYDGRTVFRGIFQGIGATAGTQEYSVGLELSNIVFIDEQGEERPLFENQNIRAVIPLEIDFRAQKVVYTPLQQ